MSTIAMPAITFDTHTFVKKLVAVGFTEQQAEVFAEQQTELVTDKLATKQDIWLLRKDFEAFQAEMRKEMSNFKAEIRRDMKELELRMTIKMGAMMVVLLSIFTSIIKFF